jgi:Spherulation-specific family 4
MPASVYTEEEIDSIVNSIQNSVNTINTALQAVKTDVDGLKTRVTTLEKATTPPPPVTSKSGLYNPLYKYPNAPEWNTLMTQKTNNPNTPFLVTINPNSGPGTSIDQNYVNLVNNLHSKNIIVIGYDYTSYGTRSMTAAKADVDKYFSWYNIDGIFYDEMNNSPGGAQYYKDLTAYIRSKKSNAFIMGNPGADTAAEYIGTCDTIIIYERGGLPSLSSLQGWHLNHDKKNFSIIPHTVPAPLDTNYVKEAIKYVGWIYITNDVMPNPWDSLCSYYTQLIAAIQ